MSNIIQFKRNLTYSGTYEEARLALQNLSSPLEAGEPILVSYSDGSETLKYFLSIGIGEGSSINLPVYASIEELNENINIEVEKILSTYSYDWISDIDIENSNVTFNRDDETGKIIVNYSGSGESVGYATEMETTICGTTMSQQEFNEMVMNILSWESIQ